MTRARTQAVAKELAAAERTERVALAVDALVEIGLLMTQQIRDGIAAQLPETFRSSAIRTSDLCDLISAVLTDEDEPTNNLRVTLYGRGVGSQMTKDREALRQGCAA